MLAIIVPKCDVEKKQVWSIYFPLKHPNVIDR